jgi:5-formyltetrahydrofolate cyclo-ligase
MTSTKALLRSQIRKQLKAIDPQSLLSQSTKVWAHLLPTPEYKSARSLCIFLNMPEGEINTHQIVAISLANGKMLYIPSVGSNSEEGMKMLRVPVGTSVDDIYEQWPRNRWKIPEPPSSVGGDEWEVAYNNFQEIEDGGSTIDLIIFPGLMFDAKGRRLGQGKGYYDKYIQKIKDRGNGGSEMPFLMGVGLECQFNKEEGVDGGGIIPTDEHDAMLDAVISPDQGVVYCKRG